MTLIEEAAASPLLEHYQRNEGVADELLDEAGRIRPEWRPFIDFFSGLDPNQIERRFERGNQYLRDAGVFFRQYDDSGSTERDWPFSHLPIIIHDSHWAHICKGLIQRADLLENILADLYGPNTLVQNGYLPAELIAKSPEWLRPMVGVKPASGHFLNLVAFEIGRGPDGTWWVLGDRTQAPSGVGFALENRLAASHVFKDYLARSNIHRLAGFFKKFRDSLYALSNDQDCGVGILTPGRLNDTYFEHAYIARYLGLMLLEGEDLTVQNGKVMVRTVGGPQPISVLWRRLDAAYADPLELNELSILGTPGMCEAVRQGNVSLINALGSGVVENRAFLAFLPRICEALRQEPLLLPNIATWWCGQENAREHVLNNAENMMIGSALSTDLPFEKNEMVPMGDGAAAKALREKILAQGSDYAAQEAITLSTTPVYQDGHLLARPMSIRVFLARTQDGWQIMPGGYARIGNDKGPTVIAMQGGGKVADVWITSDTPVEFESMKPKASSPFVRNKLEVLPSRAADNLFWLGRYTERAEFYMRTTRAYNARLSETENSDNALLDFFATFLEKYTITPDEAVPEILCQALFSAMGSAGHIRDRFSVDGWMALKDLNETALRFKNTVQAGDESVRALRILLRKISGFSGLVHESMYRHTGWRFMQMGRSLERASLMASTLAHFTPPQAPIGALDIPVDIGDSVMSHRRRYVVTTNRETVVDLLALDILNPRSILYQLDIFREDLSFLPKETQWQHLSDVAKASLKLHTDLATKTPEQIRAPFLQHIEESIYEISDLLTTAYLK